MWTLAAVRSVILLACGCLAGLLDDPMKFYLSVPTITNTQDEFQESIALIIVTSMSLVRVRVSAVAFYKDKTAVVGEKEIQPLESVTLEYKRIESHVINWGEFSTIRVIATGRVTVTLSVTGASAGVCAASLQGIPTEAWGKEYFVGNFNGCPFIIVMADQSVSIQVHIRYVDILTGLGITHEEHVGDNEQRVISDQIRFNIKLERNHAYIMMLTRETAFSLSGTSLSGNAPFGVISGNRMSSTSMSSDHTKDMALESMLSKDMAGKTFILSSTPTYPRGKGEYVTIVTTEEGNTVVYILKEVKGVLHAMETLVSYQQSFTTWLFTEEVPFDCCTVTVGQLVRIVASHPVQVFHFKSSGTSHDAESHSHDFEMSTVTPLQLFQSYYYVRVPTSRNGKNYEINFITLISETVQNYTVRPHPSCVMRAMGHSAVLNVSVVEFCVHPRNVYSIFSADCATMFAVYLSGGSASTGYYHPLLSYFPKFKCRRTYPKYADGIDNDCDGRVDEEISETSDRDRDGLKGEDLCLPHYSDGSWSSWTPAIVCTEAVCSTQKTRRCNNPPQTPHGEACYGQSLYSIEESTNGSVIPCNRTPCYDECSEPAKESKYCVECRFKCESCSPIIGMCALCPEGTHEKNGSCISCRLGYYGYACRHVCKTVCWDGKCDHVKGECFQEDVWWLWFLPAPASILLLMMFYILCVLFRSREPIESALESSFTESSNVTATTFEPNTAIKKGRHEY